MAHRVVTEKVTHLTDTHSTVMTENQGVVYLAHKEENPKFGLTKPGTKDYLGLEYRDVLGQRYSDRSGFNKDMYGDVWTFETHSKDQVLHDNKIMSVQ
jgi:hypothetical protein